MSVLDFIAPLGFLALLGIAVLIVIYLLKPNYQQKLISTSYVWEKSLKYRKRKLPINRFRNILIIICQILAICISAFVIAQPFLASAAHEEAAESIIIIDASANMRANQLGITRFERAVDEALDCAKLTIEQPGGTVSVILAGYSYSGSNPSPSDTQILIRKSTSIAEITAKLDTLTAGDTVCTYGTGDVEGAIVLAESILRESVDAKLVLFTATKYIDESGIDVRYVNEEDDFNVAILNVEAVREEFYFSILVTVVSYHVEPVNVDVKLTANGVFSNYGNEDAFDGITLTIQERCFNGEPKTIEFGTFTYYDENATDENQREFDSVRIESFDNIMIELLNVDSFAEDNTFVLFGGRAQTLKVLYHSTARNVFFRNSIYILQSMLSESWNIEFKLEENYTAGSATITEGYDFYIYEHFLPARLPQDGVVFLADPIAVEGDIAELTGLTIRNTPADVQEITQANAGFPLTAGVSHPITRAMNIEDLYVTKFHKVSTRDGFDILAWHEGAGVDYPMLLAKNKPDLKLVVMPFSVNRSNIALTYNLSFLMYNIFDYFFPDTLSDTAFEIGDTVSINTRSSTAAVTLPRGSGTVQLAGVPNVLGHKMQLLKPGAYTVSQPKMRAPTDAELFQQDSFFVTIPKAQSNFALEIDQLRRPFIPVDESTLDIDLLIYFAATLVGLLFIEWFLQTRENY